MFKKVKKFFRPRLSEKTIKPKKNQRVVLFFNPPLERMLVFSLGTAVFLAALGGLSFLYAPLIKAWANYYLTPPKTETSYQPPTPAISPPPPAPSPSPDYNDFYIFIPKIKASSQVYPNVFVDSQEDYLGILKKGVAHVKGSAFPGKGKTTYLFAHSTNTPINAVRYNAVFFLLNQLENDDLTILFFNGERYKYKVFDKKVVGPEETDYFYYSGPEETLILQTCWPPGTTWKRLLVFAKKIS